MPSFARWTVRVAILCLLFNLELHAGRVLEPIRAGMGHRQFTLRPLPGPSSASAFAYFFWSSGLRVKRVGNQACDRDHHRGPRTAPAPSGRLLGSWWRTPGYSGSGDPRLDVGVVVRCIPVSEPAPDKQQGVARHVVGAVALGVETVGYELLAGATLTTAAATAGMGAGHHVAGSAFDTVGATTVGSGFHQAGDALYAVARKSFALAGEAARSAMDSFAGPPRTQVDEQPPN